MLDIDTAIKHCEEQVAKYERQCGFGISKEGKEYNSQCAADHLQLAEWLTELKQWRRVYGICPSYEMCIPECKEGYDAQIAEHKRLLKAAVEDYPDLTDMWRYADKALELLNDKK